MTAAPFVPTHSVPVGGMPAWTAPDPAAPVAGHLDPYLPVQVVQRSGDWAHIVCSNGWAAWVDGRQLVDGSAAGPVATASTTSFAVRGTNVVTLIGGIAAALGTFLDWWSVGRFGIDGWDIPVEFLVTGKTGDGLDVGPIILVLAAVLAIGPVIGRPLPSLVLLAVSGLVLGLAGAAVIRGVREDPALYPKLGLLVTIAGGLLVASDGFGLWSRRPQ